MQTVSVPPTFTLNVRTLGTASYELAASQVLPVARERAFAFFQDPRNLRGITPDWLRFLMRDRDAAAGVFEGAEFDYTIRWLRMRFPWRSRIENYHPPERFTDVQVRGPYRSWCHVHAFAPADGGTRMRDTVTYRLPFGPVGSLVHAAVVRRQLEEIFRYRAVRIDQWARSS